MANLMAPVAISATARRRDSSLQTRDGPGGETRHSAGMAVRSITWPDGSLLPETIRPVSSIR